MEWLILCLLVPAIVVPVVLLWGFTGCDRIYGVSLPQLPPDLTATPIAIDAIRLDWVISEMDSLRFEISRAKDDGPYELLSTVSSPTLSFVDTPLESGITYNYFINAAFSDDSDNKSPPSNIASARTLAFVADLSMPQNIAPADYCFVQRISAAKLHNNGTKVRITLQGAPSGNILINSIFISRAAAAGDPYDSLAAGNAGGLTQVGSIMVLADDQPKTLDFVDSGSDRGPDHRL